MSAPVATPAFETLFTARRAQIAAELGRAVVPSDAHLATMTGLHLADELLAAHLRIAELERLVPFGMDREATLDRARTERGREYGVEQGEQRGAL